MWCRTLEIYTFPRSRLDYVKSRVSKIHELVEEVTSPPYPRVAPTYSVLDDNETMKMSLMLFVPVERSDELQIILEQMEMVVGELSVPDVCFVEQRVKYDETERPELVAEETKKVASESQSPSENDETDVGKEVEIEEEESDEEDDEVRSLDIDAGKWVKAKRDCPVCGQSKSNIVSHLQRVHKKTHRDALNLSQSMRKTKASTKNVLDRVPCPIETCNKPVKRLDKHLKTVHKLKPSSPSFIRYNTQGSKLRKDIEKEIKDDNRKKTPQKTQKKRDTLAEKGRKSVVSIPAKKPAAKRRLQLCDNPTSPSQHPSDGSPPSHHSSDSSPPSHHSSNDYPDSPDLFIDSTHSHPSDEIPTLEHPDVRAEPPEELAVPKEIQRSSIAKVVEIQPLLARFLDHLLSVEGGRRGPKPSREAQWRVGRLLYEVDETLANVNLLWNDDAMVHIRRAFIEGNHLLTKPRKVGTLRAYLSALLMFYNFLLTRASSLANEF
ncbi:Hypothetical predicted protein [Paramuricea clavata]|uniref:Uncharacterized protein n=1 Tax=Paramuricea clavata TaxID=317549 RepID=A0A7D9H9L4_PARCT|nr:Hypothetical predicted protein [Paramuricea clavata]